MWSQFTETGAPARRRVQRDRRRDASSFHTRRLTARAGTRTKGILRGTAGAIILRVILIFFALTQLASPYLKITGAILLVWIGVKPPAPGEERHGDISTADKL